MRATRPTDLTDGRVFEQPDSLWSQKGTVGWNRRRRPVQITLDLGDVQPIRGASFHTAGGEVGVALPSTIAVQVSKDDQAYYLASHHFGPKDTFGSLEQGTEAFDRALARFASRWAEHNRELGLKPGQVGICFFDEPSDPDTFKVTRNFGQAFKAGTDEILLWSNPIITTAEIEFFREAMEPCDIICPKLQEYRRGNAEMRGAYRELQSRGKRLWFYECSGPTRMGNAAYYRLQPWFASRFNATGGGFWAYADGGGSTDSWNDYPAVCSTSYTPVYFSRDRVTTSKHWEASREGIQDWQYLDMLKNCVAELKKAGDEHDIAYYVVFSTTETRSVKRIPSVGSVTPWFMTFGFGFAALGLFVAASCIGVADRKS